MSTQSSKSTTVRSAVKAALGTGVAVPLLFAAVPAMAQSSAVQDLRDQIEQMQQRLDMLEAQQDDSTTSIGNTTFDISGYVKLDAFYDFEGDQGTSLLPSDVLDDPKFGNGTGDEVAKLGWTAKQTRLRIATTTPTAMGDIGGYIEMDMYGEPGTTAGGAPRLRQAYLTWGNWLFGRAWTTFANFHYGTTLNFAGPAGQVFARQEQIRYTFDMGNGSNFAIALEDGEGRGNVDPQLPDLAMRYQSSVGDLSWQIAGLGRSVKAESDPLVTGDDSIFGWGVNTGGTLALDSGTTLKLSAAYGEAMGTYIYSPNYADTYVDSSGDLQAAETLGVIASVGQQFTDTLSGNLIYGYGHSEGDGDVFAGPGGFAYESATGQSVAVNLLYSPVDPLILGIEYAWVNAELENAAGDTRDGDGNRVQFSTIYNF